MENFQSDNISDFWFCREKLLWNQGESIVYRNISSGIKVYISQMKGGLTIFFHYLKLWFWVPRSKIAEFQISHEQRQFWADWCRGQVKKVHNFAAS